MKKRSKKVIIAQFLWGLTLCGSALAETPCDAIHLQDQTFFFKAGRSSHSLTFTAGSDEIRDYLKDNLPHHSHLAGSELKQVFAISEGVPFVAAALLEHQNACVILFLEGESAQQVGHRNMNYMTIAADRFLQDGNYLLQPSSGMSMSLEMKIASISSASAEGLVGDHFKGHPLSDFSFHLNEVTQKNFLSLNMSSKDPQGWKSAQAHVEVRFWANLDEHGKLVGTIEDSEDLFKNMNSTDFFGHQIVLPNTDSMAQKFIHIFSPDSGKDLKIKPVDIVEIVQFIPNSLELSSSEGCQKIAEMSKMGVQFIYLRDEAGREISKGHVFLQYAFKKVP